MSRLVVSDVFLESLIREYGGNLRAVANILDVEHPTLRAVVRRLHPTVNTEAQRLMQTTHKRTVSRLRMKKLLRGDLCAYCGISPIDTGEQMTIDHVVPRCLNGENNLTNMAGACYPCNQKKAAKDLLSFMLEQRREEVAC